MAEPTIREYTDLQARVGEGQTLEQINAALSEVVATTVSRRTAASVAALTGKVSVDQGNGEREDMTLEQLLLAQPADSFHHSVTVMAQDVDLIGANAAVVRIPSPVIGKLAKIKVVVTAVPSTGNPTLQAAITGVGDLSGGLVTIIQSGSAAGDVYEIDLTGTGNDNDVEEGEEITITVGGAGDTGGTANVMAIFQPREGTRPRNAAAMEGNGTSTDLRLSGDFSGGNWGDSKFGALGFDLKMNADGATSYIYSGASSGNKLFLSRSAGNKLSVLFRDSSSNEALELATAGDILVADDWRRFVITWNTNTNQIRKIWTAKLGDAAMVDDTVDTSSTGRTVDWTMSTHYLCSFVNSSGWLDGSLGNFWIAIGADAVFDFANHPEDLDQFWANGKPTLLGASPTFVNTSESALVTPDIYLGANNDWRTFGLNAGAAAGDFTTGTPSERQKPPSLPHW